MNAKARTAVIVDDDREYREAVSELLRDEGYRAVTAGTLDEARDAIRVARPHVVLLDLELVGERGDDLLDELDGRASAPATVVVSGEIDGRRRARRYGRPFVAKPAIADLLEKVEAAACIPRGPESGNRRRQRP